MGLFAENLLIFFPELTELTRNIGRLIRVQPIQAESRYLVSDSSRSTSRRIRLGRVVPDSADFLNAGLDKHIKPSLDFLKEFLETNEKIVTAIKRGSWLLSFDLKGILKPNTFLLIKEGFPRKRISQLIT